VRGWCVLHTSLDEKVRVFFCVVFHFFFVLGWELGEVVKVLGVGFLRGGWRVFVPWVDRGVSGDVCGVCLRGLFGESRGNKGRLRRIILRERDKG